ncbi:MAG: hypothetical protein AAF590_08465 [Pseudomonadota bacterium]
MADGKDIITPKSVSPDAASVAAARAILRARDFWTALVLIGVSLFFLAETFTIPIFGQNRAGVSGADWYNSAAIVPLGIFSGLLVLALILLTTSIREGGAERALSWVGIGWNTDEAWRAFAVVVIMASYIAGLVPRVDFIIATGLIITALIFGFHGGHRTRAVISMVFIALPALFALTFYPTQADWRGHTDDWVTLAFWVVFTGVVLWMGRGARVTRFIPMVAVLAPVILVTAMAFGFRQNVPARTGLLFSKIEFHYFVTLRPLWRD